MEALSGSLAEVSSCRVIYGSTAWHAEGGVDRYYNEPSIYRLNNLLSLAICGLRECVCVD